MRHAHAAGRLDSSIGNATGSDKIEKPGKRRGAAPDQSEQQQPRRHSSHDRPRFILSADIAPRRAYSKRSHAGQDQNVSADGVYPKKWEACEVAVENHGTRGRKPEGPV
jgi:hypothetical protein